MISTNVSEPRVLPLQDVFEPRVLIPTTILLLQKAFESRLLPLLPNVFVVCSLLHMSTIELRSLLLKTESAPSVLHLMNVVEPHLPLL